jgi:hypothetical protein
MFREQSSKRSLCVGTRGRIGRRYIAAVDIVTSYSGHPLLMTAADPQVHGTALTEVMLSKYYIVAFYRRHLTSIAHCHKSSSQGGGLIANGRDLPPISA